MSRCPRRRWHETRKQAEDHAAEVGGKVGSATIHERPYANCPWYTDYLGDGDRSPGTIWTPPHLYGDVKADPS